MKNRVIYVRRIVAGEAWEWRESVGVAIVCNFPLDVCGSMSGEGGGNNDGEWGEGCTLESAEIVSVLTHSPQGLSCRALVNPGTRGKEGLAKALRLLATHSLPFGNPSYFSFTLYFQVIESIY